MFYLWFFICIFIDLSRGQQFYDKTECSSGSNYPGTRYTCNSFQNSCQTFMVYKANQWFQTISNISKLLSIDPDQLLSLNNLASTSQILQPGRDVLVPINCSCSDQFFQANFSYIPLESTTFSAIACGVFDGLLKSVTLVEENPTQGSNPKVGSMLHVLLRCACPDNFTHSNGVRYLVTYPFIEGDEINQLGKKFGVHPDDIWQANHLEPDSTVFPSTTVLVPLKAKPVINFEIPASPPPSPGFLPTIPDKQAAKDSKLKVLYIAGPTVGLSLLAALVACGLKALRKWKREHFHSSNWRSSLTTCSTPRSSEASGLMTRSSTNSWLSTDLLAGIKYSLYNFSIEELKSATKDFSEDTEISGYVFRGVIDNVEVMIKQMRFEDTRQAIDVHSKINHHINIVKLLGVCYGENDFSWSYLVFEYPATGCLRDCLSNSSSPLQWNWRIQIAFDIANGLHYLHYCMVPPYTHMSINSRNIFVTRNWRAKLAVFGTIPSVGSLKKNDSMLSAGGWVAPKHAFDGLASEKVDIFAFGVVLLELISARQDIDGNSIRESIGFLGAGASEGGCFEQLRNFMDPRLKENYPLAEALCLAVLAKSCVEDDPMHRPYMGDIMKVLARMV